MKIGVLGLGLIGGSILKSLSQNGHQLFGVTRSAETLKKAAPFCVDVSNDVKILSQCKIVFVCTPISKTLESLRSLENVVSEKTIVADVASVKGFLKNEKFSFVFIGSHPMAGLETSGFDVAVENLFVGAKWVLTPSCDVCQKDISALKSIIQNTGATTLLATVDEHDEAVAFISHLPLFVAQALFKNIENNELAHSLAASGFRDTTRLALTNPCLAVDMLNYNKHNLQKTFELFQKNFAQIVNNDNDYFELALKLSESRRNLYNQDGKNNY